MTLDKLKRYLCEPHGLAGNDPVKAHLRIHQGFIEDLTREEIARAIDEIAMADVTGSGTIAHGVLLRILLAFAGVSHHETWHGEPELSD